MPPPRPRTLAFCLLALAAACAQRDRYEDPNKYFKVTVPAGWKADGGALSWKFRPEGTGPAVELYFFSQAWHPETRELDRYYDESRAADYKQGYHTHYVELERSSATLGGLPARRYAFKEDAEGKHRLAVQYLAASRDGIAVLAYKADEALFERYRSEAEASIGSVVWK